MRDLSIGAHADHVYGLGYGWVRGLDAGRDCAPHGRSSRWTCLLKLDAAELFFQPKLLFFQCGDECGVG